MTAAPTSTGPTSRTGGLSPGMGFAGLSFAANAAIVLGSAVVTSRLYGIEVIGQYALAVTPWLLLVSVSTVSEQVAMIRLLATMRPGTADASGVFYAVLTMSATLTAVMAVPVLLVSSAWLDAGLGQPDAWRAAVIILTGYVLFENPAWNLDSVLAAYSQGRRLFWCRLVTVGSFAVLAVALHFVTGDVYGLALANLGSFAIGLVARLLAVRGLVVLRPGVVRYVAGLRQVPAMLRFGLALLPGQVFIGLTLHAPLLVLAATTGIREVGAFSRASTMAARLDEAGFRITEMLFPHLVRLHRAGDTPGVVATLERSVRLVLVALLLAAALAVGAAEPVMAVFGDGFGQAAGALGFLVLAHVGYVASAMVGAAYNAWGRPSLNSVFAAVRCVVALGLVVPLSARFGITGAGLALFLGYTADLTARIFLLGRVLGVRRSDVLPATTVVRLAVVFGGSVIAGRVVVAAVPGTVAALPSALLAGGVAYALLAAAAGVLDAHDRAALAGRLRPLARAVVRTA